MKIDQNILQFDLIIEFNFTFQLRIRMESKVTFLLDRNIPFNQEKALLLDQLTDAIKNNTPNNKEAHQIWKILKDDHYFWYNADQVLQFCKLDETKFYMLVILEDAIKQKWYALPESQRDIIKAYIVNLVLQLGAIESISKSAQNIMHKANSTLVQIVKYEWNSTWKSFIDDLCSASVKDMNICENNFYILKMLSEEIFDYSKNQMTQSQIIELKNQMNKDFTTIFQLCRLILQNMHQAKPSLVRSCLETLNAFLSWIPMYYIICTDLIDKLVMMLTSDFLRNHSLSCLVEIAALKINPQDEEEKRKFMFMLGSVTQELNKLIPLSNQDQKIQQHLQTVKKKNRNIFEMLARGIANFYSEFFKNQHTWLKRIVMGNEQYLKVCHYGFKYLIMMMKIDEDQVFKITIEFFHYYIGTYLEEQFQGNNQGILGPNSYLSNQGISLEALYQELFFEIMKIITLKMAKPEEVLIVIDQDGVPVREELENTENSSLYEVEKQLAKFLVKYNWPSMKTYIISEIEKQHKLEHFNFDTLNSLSWIVGSLCGSIPDREERSFFITTLRTLLQLCEVKKGKDNKAVIASCIMYVVGQYPTFLRNNWTFLKTVVKKLFEFMKEQFPGIMEMACNAFLKIAKSTADQFTNKQLNQSEPYIREIIRRMPEYTKKITNDTLQLIFYESIGHLISAEDDPNIQVDLMKQTLGIHLFQFQNIIGAAQNSQNILKEEDVERKIIYFLKINATLATGVGKNYATMLDLISTTINNLYMYYSKEVNDTVAMTGKHVLNFMTVRIMRVVKKEVIKVYTKMLEKCNDLNEMQASQILMKFIYPLGTLLEDFHNCIAETKEQEFVALFTVVLQKLNKALTSEFLQKLVEMIFSSSLPLITSDFNSFPEIRANFFAFLKVLIKFNFQMLYSLNETHFNTILDCIIWSFRHQLSTYSDLGLDLLEEVLNNVNRNHQIVNIFYPKYHLKILTEILDVMTDGFHKSGLQAQSKLFFILIHVISQDMVKAPISADQPQNSSNSQFLYNFLVERLSAVFPNVNKAATAEKIGNWFKQLDQKLFKMEIADYLILINRYCPQEISEKLK